MQQRSDDTFFVEMHIRKDIGDGDRMREIGLAGCANLPVMRLAAELKCPCKTVGIHRRVIGTHLFNNGISCSDHRPVDKCNVGRTL